MASSGSTSVKVTEWNTLKMSWWINSQSAANNTTTIGWNLILYATSYGAISSGAAKDWSVKIDGTTYSGKTYIGMTNNSQLTLASGTHTMTHNSSGAKTFVFSFSVDINIYFNGWIGTKNGYSDVQTLDTIPRKSSLTAGNGTLGTAQTLTITKQASSYTDTITYKCGSASGTIATKSTATSISWTPPLSLASQNTTGTSVSVTLTITTYRGSTSLGSSSKTITCSIPASVKPSCSLTLEDVNGIDDIYGSPVQGLSAIKITVNTTPAYGSAIASYLVTANGATYTTASATTGVLKNSGDSPVTATVKDKRGRSGTASYTMKVQAYDKPSISKLTVHRCDADGTDNDQGENVRVNFAATVSGLSSKNTATYTLRYKKTTATSWTTVALSALANNYSVTNGSYIFAADSSSSYDVELEVKDRHNTTIKATSASTAFTLLNWGANGTSMGIGKVAELANALEIALTMYDKYGAQIGNGLAVYGGADPIDANTTTEHLCLTTQGTPTTNYWYVLTLFHGSKTPTSNRAQIATSYTRSTPIYTRYYINGTGWSAWESEALKAYPVGSIYWAYNHTDPATLFGGTWVRLENTFLWAVDSKGTIGQTGGEKTHTLTAAEIPSHNHGGTYTNAGTSRTHAWLPSDGGSMGYDTVSVGGGEAHNNMPPYTQVSAWRRTA